jgi:hypothetical protein
LLSEIFRAEQGKCSQNSFSSSTDIIANWSLCKQGFTGNALLGVSLITPERCPLLPHLGEMAVISLGMSYANFVSYVFKPTPVSNLYVSKIC